MTTRRNLLIGGGAVAVAGVGAAYVAVRGMGSLGDYKASVAAGRAALRRAPEIREFIRFAALAPSGHNTQPWRFRPGPDRIDILPDLTRRTPVVDPDDHHLFVSLGAAAETLALAAAARGRLGEPRFDPGDGGSIAFAFTQGAATDSALFAAIPARQSSRTVYDGRPVSAADLKSLAAAAAGHGVDIVLITDRPRIDRVRDLVIAGNSAQIADPAFVRELKHWLRFSPNAAMAKGDGLFSASSGSPALPAWLGPSLFDFAYKTGPETRKYAGQIDSSPGVAVFIAQKEDPEHWVLAGRACQRFALQATALGLKMAFINQPVEVAALRPDLAALIGASGRRPDLVMRFGHGPALPYSARRPVERILAS